MDLVEVGLVSDEGNDEQVFVDAVGDQALDTVFFVTVVDLEAVDLIDAVVLGSRQLQTRRERQQLDGNGVGDEENLAGHDGSFGLEGAEERMISFSVR
jgi:hypothetical protein